jgi:hypothetical protein
MQYKQSDFPFHFRERKDSTLRRRNGKLHVRSLGAAHKLIPAHCIRTGDDGELINKVIKTGFKE